jgi:hypothetical protein
MRITLPGLSISTQQVSQRQTACSESTNPQRLAARNVVTKAMLVSENR